MFKYLYTNSISFFISLRMKIIYNRNQNGSILHNKSFDFVKYSFTSICIPLSHCTWFSSLDNIKQFKLYNFTLANYRLFIYLSFFFIINFNGERNSFRCFIKTSRENFSPFSSLSSCAYVSKTNDALFPRFAPLEMKALHVQKREQRISAR